MKREFQIGIFLSIFLVIFFLLHYFVISSYFSYLSIKEGFLFYILIFILTISYPLAMLIEKKSSNRFAKYFYVLSSLWIGFLFISLFIIILAKLLDLLIFIDKSSLGLIVLSLSLIISIYSIINAQIINVKNINISLKNLKKDIKIVQLSDIHLGSINREKYLKKIVDMTNGQNPDLVVITGDLVDGSAPINKHMADHINKIKSDVFYIIGNHEIYEGLENIMPILNKTKMKIIRDEIIKYKEISFLGIDFREGNKFINEEIKKYKFNNKKPVILLYHAPSINVEDLAKRNISLHLSGHTHHGQIFPFNLFVKLAFPYSSGLHASKDKKSFVYVSPGTGTWGPPMRLGSKCEITVINLNKKKD